ncbi:MAG TPA: glycosyltransferase [Phycisphaerae bacterium]|nr:glycosyltransferase [Phycisphaerae bacterium]
MSVLTTATGFLSTAFERRKQTTYRSISSLGWTDWLGKFAIVFLAIATVALAWHFDSMRLVSRILWYSTPGKALVIVGLLYGSVATVWTIWRLWLALRYRPMPVVEDHRLPKITVIVPSFNEGPLVGSTIRHLAAADYPSDRLEIIVVNDGSDDDTWDHIEAAARQFSHCVTAINCSENRGKRWALWEGMRRATGDIFVTVDSDSIIEKDALRSVVSPMVHDPRIGGVAGNVRVLNRRDGIIPRMLSVRYVMTFDYKRAAQSMMGGGAVLCCAGALAAYRRSAVMPVLEQWLHQTFRGGPARAGEDHAMTNFIIQQGFKVVYQSSARVYTKSPTTYLGLCKMFLRWARSNTRESLHTLSYVFKAFRPERCTGIRFNYVMAALGQFLPYPFLFTALLLSLFLPTIFGLKLLASVTTASMLTLIFFAIRERSTEAVFSFVYGFYSAVMLCWIQPYALLTCGKSVWMTRVLKKETGREMHVNSTRTELVATIRPTLKLPAKNMEPFQPMMAAELVA